MDEPQWLKAKFVVVWLAVFCGLAVFCWRPADVVAVTQAVASVLVGLALLWFIASPPPEVIALMRRVATGDLAVKTPWFELQAAKQRVPQLGEDLLATELERLKRQSTDWAAERGRMAAGAASTTAVQTEEPPDEEHPGR